MKRLLFCFAILAAFSLRCAAQTPAPAPNFPTTTSIVLQSNQSMGVGLTNYVAYVLPTSAGGLEKFKIEPGLANPKYVSFESVQFPGYFLRHQNYQIKLHPFADNDNLFASDATFLPVPNPNVPGGWMFRAYSPREVWLSVTRDNALFASPNPRYDDCTFVLVP